MKEKVIRWLRIVHSGKSKSEKTDYYEVFHNDTGEYLGGISWSGKFRQYVYECDTGTFYSRGCLRDLAKFLDKLMEQWKNEQKIRSNI